MIAIFLYVIHITNHLTIVQAGNSADENQPRVELIMIESSIGKVMTICSKGIVNARSWVQVREKCFFQNNKVGVEVEKFSEAMNLSNEKVELLAMASACIFVWPRAVFLLEGDTVAMGAK